MNSHITLLHQAVADNNYDKVAKVINLGEDINAICRHPPRKYEKYTNLTALHIAVINRNKMIIELLLKNKADVNIEVDYVEPNQDKEYSEKKEYLRRTPLLFAIARKDKEMMELLIKNNADINFKTSTLETAFGLALKLNNVELINILLNAGVDTNINSHNVTSLHWAVANNNYAVAEYLINNGSDVNVVCHYPPREFFNTCCSPLHVAVNKKNRKMVELLLKNNANVNVKANCDETTACYVPMRNYFNRTPLHIAVDKEDTSIVKLLIKHKANVNIATRVGETALCIAVRKNNLSLIKILLRADAHINPTNPASNTTPIQLAVIQGNVKIIQFLLDHGPDLKHNQGEESILTFSSWNLDVIDLFKDHYVKLNALDRHSDPQSHPLKKKLDSYTKKCDDEIDSMKNTRIGVNILTFFDILTMSQHKLALKLTHVENDKVLLLKKKAKSTFPLYGELINHYLNKGVRRKKLLFKANDILFDSFKYVLPNTFLREIYYYLSDDDLKLLS